MKNLLHTSHPLPSAMSGKWYNCDKFQVVRGKFFSLEIWARNRLDGNSTWLELVADVKLHDVYMGDFTQPQQKFAAAGKIVIL